MTEELSHYGVPGMKWGVRKQKKKQDKYGKAAHEAYSSGKKRKAQRLTAKKRSYTPGTQEFESRTKRKAQLVTAALTVGVILNSAGGRALLSVGKDYVNRQGAMNHATRMQQKYGGIPDNAIAKGLEFTKRRFGSYNISSL